jgi:hypothetical protein
MLASCASRCDRFLASFSCRAWSWAGPNRSLVYGQNPPSADYQIVGNESIAVVGRKVLVFGGASMNKAPKEARYGFWFDADTHDASHAFELSGEFPTFGGTKQENIPMFSNGTQVFLWNYGRTGDLDALYTFSLTPTSGSGTGAAPYIYASRKIVLAPSVMPTPEMTYRLDYIPDWGVVVVQASSSSKVWALRL